MLTCSACGKPLTSRHKKLQLGSETVCAACLKQFNQDARPATPAQLDFLHSLGFQGEFTFTQARHTLDRAQTIRYFAFQVARQEWGSDLQGSDLRPLVLATFNDKAMTDALCQAMAQRDDQALARQHAFQEAHYKDRDYDGGPSLAECTGTLAKDPYYMRIRSGLVLLLPHLDHQRRAGRFGETIGQLLSSILKAVISGLFSKRR